MNAPHREIEIDVLVNGTNPLRSRFTTERVLQLVFPLRGATSPADTTILCVKSVEQLIGIALQRLGQPASLHTIAKSVQEEDAKGHISIKSGTRSQYKARINQVSGAYIMNIEEEQGRE